MPAKMSLGELFRWTLIIRMLWERACTWCLDDPGGRIARSADSGHPSTTANSPVITSLYPAGKLGLWVILTPLRSSTTFLEITTSNARFTSGQPLVGHFPPSPPLLSSHSTLLTLSTKYMNREHWFSKAQILERWCHALYSSDLQPGELLLLDEGEHFPTGIQARVV